MVRYSGRTIVGVLELLDINVLIAALVARGTCSDLLEH
jgi:hypothetical protein